MKERPILAAVKGKTQCNNRFQLLHVRREDGGGVEISQALFKKDAQDLVTKILNIRVEPRLPTERKKQYGGMLTLFFAICNVDALLQR